MWQDFLGKTDYWKLLGWLEIVKLLEMKNEPLKFTWTELYTAREKIIKLKGNMNKLYRMQCEKIMWQIKEELTDIKHEYLWKL